MKNRLNNSRGVTLIELMIVTVIIGIVAAMAVPRFQIAYDRMKIRGTNRALNSIIRMARSYAISDKEQYTLLLDGTENTITLFKDVQNPASLSFDSPGDSVIRVDTLPQEASYLGSDLTGNALAFQPNGSAQFTGGGNIYVLSTTENVISIYITNVLASTGRVASESYMY